ncbi:MAG TPA: MFS transporter [Polyangia bacterium]|nr:MFS transporter [Polyangia bacterium]
MPLQHAPPPAAPRRLSARTTAWVVAACLAIIYVLSTLPTPLYVVYRQALGFSKLTLTLIYAAYVVGSVGAMFFLGRLSDQVGRRPVVLASLAIGLLAVVLFLAAGGTPWLYAARIVSGLAIALASGASTAWIVEARGPADKRGGTRIAIGANLLGLGVGPLLGGILAEVAPAPRRLPYLPMLALLVVALALAWAGRETVAQRRRWREAELRPRFGVPGSIRTAFLVPAIAAFATFAVLGFYSALLPSVLQNALRQSSRALSGGVAGGMFLIAALTVALAGVQPLTGVITGLALVVPGVAMMVVAERVRSLALLLCASATIGVASGFGYFFGLELVNEMAPEDRRSEVVSGYLIVCYGAISLPVIGIGLLGTASSPLFADTLFGVLVAGLAIAALTIEIVLRARHHAAAPGRA